MIALTHMRVVNDCLFAGETSSIDLILGGHDHVGMVSSRCTSTSR